MIHVHDGLDVPYDEMRSMYDDVLEMGQDDSPVWQLSCGRCRVQSLWNRDRACAHLVAGCGVVRQVRFLTLGASSPRRAVSAASRHGLRVCFV